MAHGKLEGIHTKRGTYGWNAASEHQHSWKPPREAHLPESYWLINIGQPKQTDQECKQTTLDNFLL